MHASAYQNAFKFYNKYCLENIAEKKILDIGSYDMYGCLKPIFIEGNYIGMDMESGPNVNVVANGNDIPFKNDYFDIILSSSCFEHDSMFWVTFLEMSRVLKSGGFIYINAPSQGHYHPHPTDNWRFYIDSWKSLEKWSILNNHNIQLIESYIDNESSDEWKDSIGIFTKK
jgi:SAM-dependent methyltransferase